MANPWQEGVKLTDEELTLVKKLLEEKLKAGVPVTDTATHQGEDNDCFCEMDLDPSEATDDADLPPACGGVVG
jgi:hypothetical protein